MNRFSSIRRGQSRRSMAGLRSSIAENLEPRHMLAGDLIFSEIFYDPVAFTEFDGQYFEIRGTPGEVIPQNTYMVVVENGASPANPGEINSRFDLGGLTLGSNGFLVVAQGPTGFAMDPESTALVGTDEFDGLPGDIYAGETTVTSHFEHIFDSNTFMLIETSILPIPNQDYDANDDGILDGDAASWNVLDSISINGHHLSGDPNDQVYGEVLFRLEGNQSVAPEGVETIDLEAADYIARIGNRTGYTQADFTAGTVEAPNGIAPQIRNPGTPDYRRFAGSRLDHVGGANFYSTVEGAKFDDINQNGTREAAEPGLAGITVFLDTNQNGQHDNYTTTLSAANFSPSDSLKGPISGVTLTEENSNGDVLSGPTIDTRSYGQIVEALFALRLDFTVPVQSISIDAFELTSQNVAELAAYDVSGNLLHTYTTSTTDGTHETMTISRPSADIAMARAYYTPLHSNLLNEFDNISFSRPEPSAITDSNGDFLIDQVDLHLGGTSANLRTVGETGTVALAFDKARLFDFTPQISSPSPMYPDILGRTDNNEWWIARSTGNRFSTEFFGHWNDVPWENTVSGDLDGDGTTDFAGRIGREWWVTLSDGQSLGGAQFWGHWPTVTNWSDVQSADVNGDGQMDIIGRNNGGAWWVARSTGVSFAMEQWSHWPTSETIEDMRVGDFNGDGMSDLAGRHNGVWNVYLSDGQQFNEEQWGAWSNAVSWEDVRVGDFDGDGFDDIAGRTSGQWWLARSIGSAFQTVYWGRWSNAVNWFDVRVADFDGDGFDEIAGRANGQWWLANSNGSFFTIDYWGRWSNSVTWEDVRTGDFDEDGRADIAGRANGNWWLARSNGNFFTVEYWGRWSNSTNWNDVAVGAFSQSSVGGFSTLGDPDPLVSSPLSVAAVDELAASVLGDEVQRVRRRGRFE